MASNGNSPSVYMHTIKTVSEGDKWKRISGFFLKTTLMFSLPHIKKTRSNSLPRFRRFGRSDLAVIVVSWTLNLWPCSNWRRPLKAVVRCFFAIELNDGWLTRNLRRLLLSFTGFLLSTTGAKINEQKGADDDRRRDAEQSRAVDDCKHRTGQTDYRYFHVVGIRCVRLRRRQQAWCWLVDSIVSDVCR